MNAKEIQTVEQWRSEGHTWAQIGAKTGVSKATAQNRYWRATNPEKYKAQRKREDPAKKAARKQRSRAKKRGVSPNGPVSQDLRTLLKQALEAEIKRAVQVRTLADANTEFLALALKNLKEVT